MTYTYSDLKSLMLKKYKNINMHHLDRYFSFIYADEANQCVNTERHHILPSSMFAEYRLVKSNIKVMSARKHYLAHWCLMKAFEPVFDIDYNPMAFAFGLMSRVCRGNKSSSVLYNMARAYISEAISQANSGRPMSEKNKFDMSKRTKNTVVVKSPIDGRMFRMSCDDPRYKSGEYVFYRVGYKHSDETKRRMSDSGIKDRTAYTDGDDVIFLRHGETPPNDGWVKGVTQKSVDQMKNLMTDNYHYTNAVTGETCRSKDILDYPWERSRKKCGDFKGFDDINKSKNYRNVYTLEVVRFLKSEQPPVHYINCGVKPNNIMVFEYKRCYIIGFTALCRFMANVLHAHKALCKELWNVSRYTKLCMVKGVMKENPKSVIGLTVEEIGVRYVGMLDAVNLDKTFDVYRSKNE